MKVNEERRMAGAGLSRLILKHACFRTTEIPLNRFTGNRRTQLIQRLLPRELLQQTISIPRIELLQTSSTPR